MIAAWFNEPSSDFLCEGLAMFMDGKWWNKPNQYWVKQFLDENICPKPSAIMGLSENEFWNIETGISYPLSGAWVEFFITEYGIDKFLNVYSQNSDYIKQVEKQTNRAIRQIDEQFFNWVLQHSL